MNCALCEHELTILEDEVDIGVGTQKHIIGAECSNCGELYAACNYCGSVEGHENWCDSDERS